MSFLSIVQNIEKVALVLEPIASPIIAAIDPEAVPTLTVVDHFVQKLQGSVIATEISNPVDGQGASKSVAVNSDLNTYIDEMNKGLAMAGEMIQDDKDLRQIAIDSAVKDLNDAAKWRASFKVVEIPKP